MGQQFNEHSSILPEDFDGDFYFSNPDTEEFIGMWGSKAYHYAPQARSKMVIRGAAPEEVQQIRKKFAKELGERMFFKSAKAKQLEGIEHMANGEPVMRSIHQANTYSERELAPYIQACLDELPITRATMTEIQPDADIEEKLTKDEDGDLVSRAVRNKESLKEKVFKDAPTA